MSEEATGAVAEQAALRDRILRNPGAVLEDRDVMRALLSAGAIGTDTRNIVDLRGKLVERLEDRLDRLEETHRSVIAAAYENLAGTHQIHRVVLALMDAGDFRAFLQAMAHDVQNILSLDVIRLGLETTGVSPGTALGPAGPLADLVIALPRGATDDYITGNPDVTPRRVTLRACKATLPGLYDGEDVWVRSEALIRLDLGPGNLPGLLALGAQDANRFHPDQGVDLLNFLGGVFERLLRRWLA